MARGINKLSERFCIKAKLNRGTYSDGGGLYLQVSKTGTRAWIMRYMMNGVAHNMGLGKVGVITLADARVKARAAQSLIVDGVDPITERRDRKAAQHAEQVKLVTFEACARDYIEKHRAEWTNAKHAAQWITSLEKFVFPVIGKLPVAVIGVSHIEDVLRPIWLTKAETARRVRARIEMVLDRATALELRSGDNPAGKVNVLTEKLGVQPKTDHHHDALDFRDVPAFMTTLRKQDGITARALEWVILTATRSGETLGARWSEIDLRDRTWTIPASRTKRKVEQRVPLSDRATAILATLPRNGALVFAGIGRPHAALLDFLKTLNPGVTVHGFRASFRTWGGERNYDEAVLERALGHSKKDKVTASYDRGDKFETRRRLMADWAAFCEGRRVVGDKIVSIARR